MENEQGNDSLFDTAVEKDSLIAVHRHFLSFFVIRLPVTVEFLNRSRLNYWAHKKNNWRNKKCARELRSRNQFQRQCKKANRCRVFMREVKKTNTRILLRFSLFWEYISLAYFSIPVVYRSHQAF